MLTKVILQANIDKVETYFERADKIVIVTHVSPDGDALGSSLGLYHFLCQQGKTVNVIVPNAFPDFLRWMPGAKDAVWTLMRFHVLTHWLHRWLLPRDAK